MNWFTKILKFIKCLTTWLYSHLCHRCGCDKFEDASEEEDERKEDV